MTSRRQSDTVKRTKRSTTEIVFSVCDKPYHTNKQKFFKGGLKFGGIVHSYGTRTLDICVECINKL